MSSSLINRSPDLTQLRNEGFDIEVRGGYLLVHQIPYVNNQAQVIRGTLASDLTLAGNVTAKPSDHVVLFIGTTPCDSDGHPLTRLIHSSDNTEILPGLVASHKFSSKPPEGYPDYHAKMTAYASILTAQAEALEPGVSARVFPVVVAAGTNSPFAFEDTASSRAGIGTISAKLEGQKLAIVGLGGTGSYLLDSLAKCPVAAIHIFDGDVFHLHNAFRAPGAPTEEELALSPRKVEHFYKIYSRFHRGIIPHPHFLDSTNVHELRDLDYVFIAIDGGEAKKDILQALETWRVPFIDVGIGLYDVDGSLAGTIRVTKGSPDQTRSNVDSGRIPFSTGGNNEYDRNIQIVELNSLNASLAIIRWKKDLGFYLDLEHERFTAYEIDGNHILNEDRDVAD